MALITNLVTAALSKLVGEEISAWSPRAVRTLVKTAVRWLPKEQQPRFVEEWQSHLDEVPGTFWKLLTAFGFLLAASKMRRTASHMNSANRSSIDPVQDAMNASDRLRESVCRASGIAGSVYRDETLASDESLQAFVKELYNCLTESADSHHETLQRLVRWAEERRKRRPIFRPYDKIADALAYRRTMKFVIPKFNRMPRDADHIARLTDQLIEMLKAKRKL